MYGRIVIAVFIGLCSGYLRVWLEYQTHVGAGDFFYSLRIIRDLWQGHDPFDYPVGPDLVSYPLTAGLFAAPFAFLPDDLAAGVFFGFSSGLFAWLLLRKKTFWPLLILLSWPYVYALAFAQYSPLIACIWFMPALSPLVLVKPQSALPLILSNKISWKGLTVGAAILVASLVIYPGWPFVWFEKIGSYEGSPPLFSLPLGPILMLALLKHRDQRAWLLILMALMPQRMIYDQLPLMLIAASGFQGAFLAFFSWLSLPVLLSYKGWIYMPINWQFWIVLTLYIPALIVLFWQDINPLGRSILQKIERPVNMGHGGRL